MTASATAVVPTAQASRYLQQLCKHWSHNLKVDFTAREGTVLFPRDARGADWPDEARLALAAGEEDLTCRIEASSDAHLEAMKEVVASHLDRFAFREAPLTFNWSAG